MALCHDITIVVQCSGTAHCIMERSNGGVAKEGSTSGIRTQQPCLSGTVPYRLGYGDHTHTRMGPSCYTAPPPQQTVSSRRTYSQGGGGVRWVVGSSHCQASMLQKKDPRAGFEPNTPVFPGQCRGVPIRLPGITHTLMDPSCYSGLPSSTGFHSVVNGLLLNGVSCDNVGKTSSGVAQ